MKQLDIADIAQNLRTSEADLAKLLSRREGIGIQTSPEFADEVQYHMDRELAARSLSLEYRHLVAVRAALQRITDAKYGLCQRCDEEIGVKRLRALPWASLCIRCQEQIDTQQGRGCEPEYKAANAAI